MSNHRYAFVLMVLAAAASVQARPEQATASDIGTPSDYFQRGDELTNIRMSGSPPFHMKVAFHGYPPVDFNPSHNQPATSTATLVAGHPFVMSGDGTYEETWISPEKWRREVAFADYRAVEVRADRVRKFQANSDYEPARVLMLLDALLQPISRYLIEPRLDSSSRRWKMERLVAGSIPFVRLSHTVTLGQNDFSTHLITYEFLGNGVLVRFKNFGQITTWQDDAAFGGKVVPRQIAVRSPFGPLVDATVTIEPLHNADPQQFQLPGGPADPGMTLPRVSRDTKQQAEPLHGEPPRFPPEMNAPPGAGILALVAISRAGEPREMEVLDASPAPAANGKVPNWLKAGTALLLTSVQKTTYKPATVDNYPCQVYRLISVVNGML